MRVNTKIYKQGIVNGEETPAWVAFTYGINMTRNQPGTFPIGLSTQGLPIGIQSHRFSAR